MRLVWRAATAFADKGWPVIPWEDGPLEPFASSDAAQVAEWAERYGSANVFVDLVGAGLFVLQVEGDAGFRSLVDLFDAAQDWPDDGVLTMATPSGWMWFIQQPQPPVRHGPIAKGVAVETQWAVVPGGSVPGGVARLEVVGELAASPCPRWLRTFAPVAHA